MALISDPSENKLSEEFPPQAIVSLCPPITELLFDIGLKGRVVGVSKQCRFPEVCVREAVSVGSNKRPDIKRILEMQPDFVVLDSRETDEAVVSLLREELPVWDSDTSSVLEAIDEIRALGRIMGKPANADWIAAKIETRFAEFQASFVRPAELVRAVLLASYKPWSAIGGNTIANELLGYIGVENAWSSTEGVFPVEHKKIPGGTSTSLLLAEGPYSFHKRHLPVVNRRYPDIKASLIREDLLTWHGSRLLRAPGYLKDLSASLAQ